MREARVRGTPGVVGARGGGAVGAVDGGVCGGERGKVVGGVVVGVLGLGLRGGWAVFEVGHCVVS